MIAIVDYGMGNLKSVCNALESIGEKARIIQNPADLKSSAGIILPGVGAFRDGMDHLREHSFLEPLQEEVLRKKKPYLGICLGMQFLAEQSEEGGRHPGLGWVPGTVRQIVTEGQPFKVPHMGWNDLRLERPSALYAGLPEEPVFYFVHSFHLQPTQENKEWITATCQHGTTITASLQKDNIFGVQFHPEKSQRVGLQLLKNFIQFTHAYAEKTADPCPYPA